MGWADRRDRADETARILALCKELHEGIRVAGLEATLDDDQSFMPGSKFKHWEQRGVKLRIELGPRDYRNKLLTIAITTIPGQMAQKQTIKHITSSQVADHLKRLMQGMPETTSKHVKFDGQVGDNNDEED